MKFPGGGGMGQLLAQAQKMQSEMKVMQEKLSLREMDVSSAGGRIKIKINGKQEIINLELSPELLEMGDASMLSDMVKVAVNEAVQASQQMVASEMSKVIPPGLGGLF